MVAAKQDTRTDMSGSGKKSTHCFLIIASLKFSLCVTVVRCSIIVLPQAGPQRGTVRQMQVGRGIEK
ncbi:hypothetical protein [Novosphingobium beihaiensis]|uniref:Uncharacterized protein n=1 Tax=Novosphingobium beihaiensis TaxID=2930389 RepID=A0ABT0BSB5_9SPHN|nr:hypothetical protein [Novosphingobium beihaiensis]MCJ2187942.1 hypothetical protein [Novosphingobium beihaiensis]